MGADPILIDLPDEILTDRLVIRPPRPGTGAVIREAVLESVESLRPWMEWAQRPASAEEQEALVRGWAAEFQARRDLPLHLWDRETGAFVGGSGLHRIGWRLRRFEIGYWCRDAYVGRGLVTEAVRAITALAFERLDARRVEIRCDTRNHRSAAVAERAGFVHESTRLCDDLAPDGSVRDTHVFRLVRAEYDALRARASQPRTAPSTA